MQLLELAFSRAAQSSDAAYSLPGASQSQNMTKINNLHHIIPPEILSELWARVQTSNSSKTATNPPNTFTCEYISSPTKQIFDLVNEAYSVELTFKRENRFVSLQEMKSYFENGDFIGLVPEDGKTSSRGTYSAVVCIQQDSKNNDALYFGCLAVSPSLQGTGIGSKIIQLLEAMAKRLGKSHLILDAVNVREKLISYYKKRGFQSFDDRDWPADFKHLLREECRNEIRFVMMRRAVLNE